MTFNLTNAPCMEIDGNLWLKTMKFCNLYVIDNNIIFKTSDNSEEKPEILVLCIDIFKKIFGENVISSSIVPDPISIIQNFKPITFQFKVNQLTNDFHSIKPVGKGGFGRVYSAISKIDCQIYAIKKVIINCSKFNKKEIASTLKEFLILAKLNHGNIVRYHTAWFEKIDEDDWDSQVELSDHFSESYTKNISKISPSSSFTNNSSLKGFTDVTMSQTKSSSDSSIYDPLNKNSSNNDSHPDSSIEFEYSSNLNNKNDSFKMLSKDKYKGTLELYKSANVPKFKFALYIQMELCHLNLQDWLTNRNKQSECLQKFDLKNARCIARQLLKGVEYIHSNKVIHRDIKPANIFLTIHPNKNIQLKIGDFGLSKYFEYDTTGEMPTGKKVKLTANTGTAFYSSPEVFNTKLKRIFYNHKCDLYSVGVILLELMVKFSTMSELSHVITDISKGNPFKGLTETWPLEDPHVRNLISIDPEKRPEASFLLNETCCFKELYIQNGLYDHIKNIMSENSNLKSENELLRKTLESLLSKNSR